MTHTFKKNKIWKQRHYSKFSRLKIDDIFLGFLKKLDLTYANRFLAPAGVIFYFHISVNVC